MNRKTRAAALAFLAAALSTGTVRLCGAELSGTQSLEQPVSSASEDAGYLKELCARAEAGTLPLSGGEPVLAGKLAVYADGDLAYPDSFSALAAGADYLGIPAEYLAGSLEEADTAVLIFPENENIGHYTGGVIAERTITKLVSYDLRAEKASDPHEIGRNDPPLTVTVKGHVDSVKGDFLAEKAGEYVAAHAAAASSGNDAAAGDHAASGDSASAGVSAPAGVGAPSGDSASAGAGAAAAGDAPAGGSAESAAALAGDAAADGTAKTPPDDAALAAGISEALAEPLYLRAYQALSSGAAVGQGSSGETASALQTLLNAFGRELTVDGKSGQKTMAALAEVQAGLELPAAAPVDAEGFLELMKRLLPVENREAADELQAAYALYGTEAEYAHARGCALLLAGKNWSAREAFEETGNAEDAARAAGCILPWPETGQLTRNDTLGQESELSVQFNSDDHTAMLVRIYTAQGEPAAELFIGGTGSASVLLPGGDYVIKDGTGTEWYGSEEAFGANASYQVMTFEGGARQMTLEPGYAYEITVNIDRSLPGAEGVGSVGESWEDF